MWEARANSAMRGMKVSRPKSPPRRSAALRRLPRSLDEDSRSMSFRMLAGRVERATIVIKGEQRKPKCERDQELGCLQSLSGRPLWPR